MKNKNCSRPLKTISFCLMLCAAFLTGSASAQTNSSRILTSEFKWSADRSVKMPYLYYLPKDYKSDRNKRWPIMLFLHGAGERGTNLSRVAVHGPLKLVNQGREFPFIIIAPLCYSKTHWDNAPLLGLLEHVTRQFRADTNRVYLTGLSMGGYETWDLGLAYPETFAAIAPLCGGGNMIDPIVTRNDKPEAFLSLPIWAFHCDGDPTVPLEESTRMVDKLKKLGCAEVKLTVYHSNKHDCWTQAYDTPELYDWFLSHKRN